MNKGRSHLVARGAPVREIASKQLAHLRPPGCSDTFLLLPSGANLFLCRIIGAPPHSAAHLQTGAC